MKIEELNLITLIRRMVAGGFFALQTVLIVRTHGERIAREINPTILHGTPSAYRSELEPDFRATDASRRTAHKPQCDATYCQYGK